MARSLARPWLETFLDDIRDLVLLEWEFDKLPLSETIQLRKKQSSPLVQSIEKPLQEYREQVTSKSKLGDVLTYLDGQWESLIVFLEHSEAELSNNRIENHIRPFAIGRKNWRFADTTKGAAASATIYSVVCSAKAKDMYVHSYLTFLLTELPKAFAKNPRNPDLSPFLPRNFNPLYLVGLWRLH
jgi:transposase